MRLDLAEDVENNNDSDVDETDDHNRVWSEFQSVDVFLKECKLVSLVALRPALHVRQPRVPVWCLCPCKRTSASFLFLLVHSK